MTPRPNALLLAIVCTGVLAGCAIGPNKRTLIPPSTSEGQACLPKCDLIRTQCEGRQQGREQECLQRYATAKSEYDLCIQSGSESCKEPEPCTGADMGICRIEYDECFTACGGRVEKGFAMTPSGRTSGPESTEAPKDAGDPP